MKKNVLLLLVGILIGSMLFSTVAYATNINVSFSGIKLYVGGILQKPSQQPFVYNGTPYVPIKFVSEALGQSVEWDKNKTSIYIGGRPQGSFLTDIITPYDVRATTINEKFEIGNDKYYKTIISSPFLPPCWAAFNLKGKYSRLTLQVASKGGGSIPDGSIIITGDDKVLWEGEMKSDDLPQKLDLNVKGVNKLKFDGEGYWIVLDPRVYP